MGTGGRERVYRCGVMNSEKYRGSIFFFIEESNEIEITKGGERKAGSD